MSEQHEEYQAGLEIARKLIATKKQRDALREALTVMADRFERCLIQSGTAPEFAAEAVKDARALVAQAESPSGQAVSQ